MHILLLVFSNWLNTLPIFYWFIFHPVQPRLNRLNHDRKVSPVKFSLLLMKQYRKMLYFISHLLKTRMTASSLLWFTTTTTMKPYSIRWDWYIKLLLLESKSILDWWISNFWPDLIRIRINVYKVDKCMKLGPWCKSII